MNNVIWKPLNGWENTHVISSEGIIKKLPYIDTLGRYWGERTIKPFKSRGGYLVAYLDSPLVQLKNASHIIKDLWWEGNNLMGRVEILNTPFGNIVSEILKAGYAVGISSRGTGSVTETEDGQVIVNDDFDLVTWDFVSNPSVQGAFMKPTRNLSEGMVVKQRDYSKVNSILNDILRN